MGQAKSAPAISDPGNTKTSEIFFNESVNRIERVCVPIVRESYFDLCPGPESALKLVLTEDHRAFLLEKATDMLNQLMNEVYIGNTAASVVNGTEEIVPEHGSVETKPAKKKQPDISHLVAEKFVPDEENLRNRLRSIFFDSTIDDYQTLRSKVRDVIDELIADIANTNESVNDIDKTIIRIETIMRLMNLDDHQSEPQPMEKPPIDDEHRGLLLANNQGNTNKIDNTINWFETVYLRLLNFDVELEYEFDREPVDKPQIGEHPDMDLLPVASIDSFQTPRSKAKEVIENSNADPMDKHNWYIGQQISDVKKHGYCESNYMNMMDTNMNECLIDTNIVSPSPNKNVKTSLSICLTPLHAPQSQRFFVESRVVFLKAKCGTDIYNKSSSPQPHTPITPSKSYTILKDHKVPDRGRSSPNNNIPDEIEQVGCTYTKSPSNDQKQQESVPRTDDTERYDTTSPINVHVSKSNEINRSESMDHQDITDSGELLSLIARACERRRSSISYIAENISPFPKVDENPNIVITTPSLNFVGTTTAETIRSSLTSKVVNPNIVLTTPLADPNIQLPTVAQSKILTNLSRNLAPKTPHNKILSPLPKGLPHKVFKTSSSQNLAPKTPQTALLKVVPNKVFTITPTRNLAPKTQQTIRKQTPTVNNKLIPTKTTFSKITQNKQPLKCNSRWCYECNRVRPDLNVGSSFVKKTGTSNARR